MSDNYNAQSRDVCSEVENEGGEKRVVFTKKEKLDKQYTFCKRNDGENLLPKKKNNRR